MRIRLWMICWNEMTSIATMRDQVGDRDIQRDAPLCQVRFDEPHGKKKRVGERHGLHPRLCSRDIGAQTAKNVARAFCFTDVGVERAETVSLCRLLRAPACIEDTDQPQERRRDEHSNDADGNLGKRPRSASGDEAKNQNH